MFMNECRLNHTHMKFEFKILLSSLPMFVWNNRVNRTYFFIVFFLLLQKSLTKDRETVQKDVSVIIDLLKNEEKKYHLPGNYSLKGHLKV